MPDMMNDIQIKIEALKKFLMGSGALQKAAGPQGPPAPQGPQGYSALETIKRDQEEAAQKQKDAAIAALGADLKKKKKPLTKVQ
jgi:hypothetical protein